MEVILQETNVLVYFEKEQRTLVVEWKARANMGEYKFAHEHALFFAKKGNVRRFLLDQRHLPNPDFRSRMWTIFNFLPAVMIDVGTQAKVAILPSLSGRDAFSSYLLKLKKAPLVRLFENREEAMGWLGTTSKD